MDEPFQCVKSFLLNFKLNNCCYFASVKIGLLLTAYFNVIYDISSIIGISDESYSPIIKLVEDSLLEDNATKPVPILCYSTELAFNVILLCAVYRKDLCLMTTFVYFGITSLTTSILIYSVVIVATGAFMKIAIVLSILFQLYVILLVRSMIVEIKQARKNELLPTVVMSSLLRNKHALIVHDAETQVDQIEPNASDTLGYNPLDNYSHSNIVQKPKKENIVDDIDLKTTTDRASDMNEKIKPSTLVGKPIGENQNIAEAKTETKEDKTLVLQKEAKLEIVVEEPKAKIVKTDSGMNEEKILINDNECNVETIVEKPKKKRWFIGKAKPLGRNDKPSPLKKNNEKQSNLETVEEMPKM
ncbi:uncharacterized protein LOC101746111 [Bombyx mori]|uniref:Uncharacterized protein n=1 Tax=Bombyx mori TaxID=7091 RepID=A0A8R2AN55_BOMMO|nr:uncharacterized protein LOC101746111 [Bombyx mori]